MIKCDPSLFRYDYVRLKKITSGFLFITSDSLGNVYKLGEKSIYKKREIKKLKIHSNVYSQYLKNNTMREFSDLGTFACIAFYDDVVVALEIKKNKTNIDESKSWVSTIEKVMNNIHKIIPSDKNVYINGKEIFWVNDEENDKIDSEKNIDNEGFFTIKKVKYLSLNKIGAEIASNQSNKKDNDEEYKEAKISDIEQDSFEVIKTIGIKNITSEMVETLDFDVNYASYDNNDKMVVAIVKDSFVLSYNPNFGTNLPPIKVYSPVFSILENEMNNILKTLYQIIDSSNPLYLNLNFVEKSGKLIGEKYGYEETEILNVPKIILDTKVISFCNITNESKQNYGVEIPPFVGLAWLFKFINKEKNLNELRDLCNLFNYVLNKGFVARNNIVINFKEGKSEDDIKLISFNSGFNKNVFV